MTRHSGVSAAAAMMPTHSGASTRPRLLRKSVNQPPANTAAGEQSRRIHPRYWPASDAVYPRLRIRCVGPHSSRLAIGADRMAKPKKCARNIRHRFEKNSITTGQGIFCSTPSIRPWRGGSRIVSASSATSTPGRPTMMNASCQGLNCANRSASPAGRRSKGIAATSSMTCAPTRNATPAPMKAAHWNTPSAVPIRSFGKKSLMSE